jgi:branched-chain amino acid transport system ATP-binding protein
LIDQDEAKLKVENVGLYFGKLRALDSMSLEVRGTEILAIIGPNGAGKSCLLNCINGFYRPQDGNIFFEGKNITRLATQEIAELGISLTFQNIELYSGLSVLDNLMAARHIRMKQGALTGAIYFGPAYREELEHRKVVEDIIDFLEMEPIRKKVVDLLPYGMRKRVETG